MTADNERRSLLMRQCFDVIDNNFGSNLVEGGICVIVVIAFGTRSSKLGIILSASQA
jgi:hypothetical protein